jgi:K+-transporting ATPase ATPase C chain
MTEAEMAEPHDPERMSALRRTSGELRRTLVITTVLAILAGVVFPAVILATGHLAFPAQAGGSLARDSRGEVIGSSLLGQAFSGAAYFHGRPSAAGADGYDGSASSGLNLALTNPKLPETIQDRARAYREENGLAADTPLPADAVTTSASGLDPDISPANARLQVARVADARGLPRTTVRDLVERSIEAPLLGFIGEPMVNVLELNLALNDLAQ